jgi:AAA+ ATPase superfamily predicted ATPase
MIGRKKELEIIKDCMKSDRSRLIVVYGRRRVGKTFLVREAFNYKFTFTHTGLEDGNFNEQLSAFWRSVKSQGGYNCQRPQNWFEAFDQLKNLISSSNDKRKTVFIDELPWMDTRNSGFVMALSDFWNGWASARTDVVMIVCGSAAAWMVKKVLHNRGGLFNRANRTICLQPFTLAECERYMESEGVAMDRKDIVSAYMVLGGSPYYWSLLEKGESLSQNIDRLFFSEGAELKDEFSKLYRSVFENPEPYVEIVTALGTKKAGLTRSELIATIPDAKSSGTLTQCLENLERSGFIRRYSEPGKTCRGSIYQLIDNLTLFYFRFVRDYNGRDTMHWSHLIRDQKRVSWEGIAFERVCLLHSWQIKKALGISGVASEESAWRCLPSPELAKGAQIDLVIDRADRVTNLCEMKFASEQYSISKDEADEMRRKTAAFKLSTGTRNPCHVTYVTTYGVQKGKHSSVMQSQVTMDDLFAE